MNERNINSETVRLAVAQGVDSITASASTPLTLTGGTSGASLVLGQGTTAGAITATPTGTGVFTVKRGLAASATGTAFFIQTTDPTSFGLIFELEGNATSANRFATINSYMNGDTGRALVLNRYGGNVLIGTSTDAANLSGGLVINGSGTASAASSTTTGALRVTGGVGVSGAGYFGGYIYAGDGSADARIVAQTNNPYALAVNRGGSGNGRFYLGATAVASPSLIFSNNAGTEVASITSAGAATFAGAVTIGGVHTVSSPAPYQLLTATAGTNYAYTEYVNTGNNLRIGLENSSGASIVPGAPAYSAFVASVGARSLVFATNNIVRQTIDSTGAATFAGAVTIAGTVIHTLSATPASASATGTVGTMSWDANYIYICTATNTWKRVAIATW